MTAKELAEMLSGREVRNEITAAEARQVAHYQASVVLPGMKADRKQGETYVHDI